MNSQEIKNLAIEMSSRYGINLTKSKDFSNLMPRFQREVRYEVYKLIGNKSSIG
jgi:hypothetical protein